MSAALVLECEHEDDDGLPVEYETPFAEAAVYGHGPDGVVRWYCAAGDEHECGVGEL